MEDRIRRHIDELFNETTPTRKAVELKEEMIQNLTDKYRDLIGEGKTEEAAYNITIAGIGDISTLLAELEKDMTNLGITQEMQDARRKSALLTSVAVMMYILAALPLIVLSIFDVHYAAPMGLLALFIMVAGATGLLIYNSMTKPTYNSETMVEEFREWQTEDRDRRGLRKAISSALWSIILAIYFIVSFMTGAWFITWIIFIIGAAIESLLNVFFNIRKGS